VELSNFSEIRALDVDFIDITAVLATSNQRNLRPTELFDWINQRSGL
jgi:hypothetical protein